MHVNVFYWIIAGLLHIKCQSHLYMHALLYRLAVFGQVITDGRRWDERQVGGTRAIVSVWSAIVCRR